MGSPFTHTSRLAIVAIAAASLATAAGGVSSAAPVSPHASETAKIVADPTLTLSDGIIQGNLNITGAASQQLRFSFVSSSKGGKLSLGNVPHPDPRVQAQSFTVLPYADWLDGASSRGSETFVVRATPIPKAGAVRASTKPTDIRITVNVGELAPGTAPLSFTHMVAGYAGTPISVNFFPASGLVDGDTAPLVLQGSALGAPGNTDPYQEFDTASRTPGTAAFRLAPAGIDFNVVTWDPRGSYASGGVYQLNDPFIDGIDVRRIITWATDSTPTMLNGSGDPAMGMVGGSAGGEIQLVTAASDPRVDAIAPANTWNSLIDSLQPNDVLDTSVASALLAALSKPQIRLSPQLRSALKGGISSGRLTSEALTMLANNNVSTLLSQLQAPTLLWQDSTDPLFTLSQPMDSAQTILGNPYGTPVKMAWFPGASTSAAVEETMRDQTVAWMGKYVAGLPIPDAYTPHFQWWDQADVMHTSSLLPFEPGFNLPDPISGTSSGGRLPTSASCAKPASGLAVKVRVRPGAQIAGIPSISMSYRGTGKAQALCVRVSDASTKEVLGAPASVIPMILDGKRHTAAYPLSGVTYTGQADSELTITLWAAVPKGTKAASVRVSVSDVTVTLPEHALEPAG